MRYLSLLLCLFLFSGCALIEHTETEKPDLEAGFHEWLKHKRNYRKYSTLEDAREAYREESERKRKEQEWKDYKIEKKIGFIPADETED